MDIAARQNLTMKKLFVNDNDAQSFPSIGNFMLSVVQAPRRVIVVLRNNVNKFIT